MFFKLELKKKYLRYSKNLNLKGVMVRLMLVLAPVMCILSAIGISAILVSYMKNLEGNKQDKKTKKMEDNYPKKPEVF